MKNFLSLTNLIIILVITVGGWFLFKGLTYSSINKIQNAKLSDLTSHQPATNNPEPTSPTGDQPTTPPYNLPTGPNESGATPPLPQIGAENNQPTTPPAARQPVVSTGALSGKWLSNNDGKTQFNFNSDQTVEEIYNGKTTARGTWEFVKQTQPTTGPSTQTLQVNLNNQTYSYQIINLSATNLSYVNSQGDIVSFKRLAN